VTGRLGGRECLVLAGLDDRRADVTDQAVPYNGEQVATSKVVKTTWRIVAVNYLVVLGKAPKAPPMEPLLIVR
jgi:hypothetical protein